MRISDWSSDVCSSDLHHLEADRGAEQQSEIDPPAALRLRGPLVHHQRIGRERQGLVEDEQREHVAGEGDAHGGGDRDGEADVERSEEHTSELQSLIRISYAVFCLKKKIQKQTENYGEKRVEIYIA